MSKPITIALADCTQFRQTLALRAPAIVHGTALLLVGLLLAAVSWSSIVRANLVVRALGRVRPLEIPNRIFASFGQELDGRVVEASIEEGTIVRRGDTLIRLNTDAIDNHLAKVRRTIETSQAELAELSRMDQLLGLQFDAAYEKAHAELNHAESQLKRATEQRESEIRRCRNELETATDHWSRCQQLQGTGAISKTEVVEAESKVRQAQEKIVQAQFVTHSDQVDVARKALELVRHDSAVRRAEIESRKVAKQGEVESNTKELAHLELQRQAATVTAPIDGVVVSGRIHKGDVIESGKSIIELVPQLGYRFEAAVPTEDAGQLRVGMPVQIKFDAYDYQKYGTMDGVVTYISPDSKVNESKDKPSQSTFVVRVEMREEQVSRGHCVGKIKLGLGGTAEIVVGQESVLMILVKRIRHSISLG